MPTTTPSTTTADRRAPTAYLAGPRTLQERMRYLEADAARILAAPHLHLREEVQWAADMLRATRTSRTVA